MIDKKLAIITIHDVNPSHSEKIVKTCDELNKLQIKYNLSIVPYYDKKYNLKDHVDFCKQISSLVQSGSVELTLHGLYHQVNGKLDDFDTGSKEDEEEEIQQGLGILSSAAPDLPRPSTFIPPAWHLSRQCVQALKELNFAISESVTNLEFIQKGKKYIIQRVMSWDQQADKEKNKPTLHENKEMFYKRLFSDGGTSHGLFRMAIHPPHDPDGALEDQIEMIKYLKENQGYEFVKYLDLLESDESA
jgi:predicted deacetylase